ncbi:hypothetical protein SHKM778_57910 [Streptomyces sp. KM77-8]|uniref:MFS transporter n=1 Tax=Streptomyces haneummycinicus TaxID=3074435 RepID=A0AAT9HPW1_9ACTN
MGRLTVLALRMVIVALLAGSLAVQTVLVPLMASDLEGLDAEYADLRAPSSSSWSSEWWPRRPSWSASGGW